MNKIDKLIINSPFEEPKHYWYYDNKSQKFSKEAGRRPAGYVIASESKSRNDMGKFVEIPAGRLACQPGVPVAVDYFAVFQEFDAVYFQSMAAGSEDEAHPPEFFKISGRNGPVQITPFRGYRRGGPVSYN